VKEKATVRKKRVSKAETKGDESDSSDLDQKEAANKTTPPKTSRFAFVLCNNTVGNGTGSERTKYLSVDGIFAACFSLF
jgi:hypothetical protein